MRKSWSLTGVAVLAHLAPGFLNRPIISRFLVSTLMMGRPWRSKRLRARRMDLNCRSRSAERVEQMVFLLT